MNIYKVVKYFKTYCLPGALAVQLSLSAPAPKKYPRATFLSAQRPPEGEMEISNLEPTSLSPPSQVTLPKVSTARYLSRWDLRQMVSPSPDGSRVQICFFLRDAPLALILKPKVSAVRYLNWALISPMVQQPRSVLSSALWPFMMLPLLPLTPFILWTGDANIDFYCRFRWEILSTTIETNFAATNTLFEKSGFKKDFRHITHWILISRFSNSFKAHGIKGNGEKQICLRLMRCQSAKRHVLIRKDASTAGPLFRTVYAAVLIWRGGNHDYEIGTRSLFAALLLVHLSLLTAGVHCVYAHQSSLFSALRISYSTDYALGV